MSKPSKIVNPAKPWFEPDGLNRGNLGSVRKVASTNASSRKLKATWRIDLRTGAADGIDDLIEGIMVEETKEPKLVDYESDWS